MIGTTLGAYEIREEVGRGGMAVVYRAHQPTVDRDVAIKVILKGVGSTPGAIQRFQREARLIARLEHPHILPIYDFDGNHEPPYIVMRYLDGGTLREVMAQGLLPLDEVAYLMRQVCAALDYAHRQGIIHRDIKPSNILIDREGNAFVSDFGLARSSAPSADGEPITESGAIMGTPDYMSPEQATGQGDINGQSDLYALGVMLFQMLTGILPFSAPSPMAMLYMHIQSPVPMATSIRNDLPDNIDAVIQRVLAKDREARYANAAELAMAITDALGSSISNASQLREAAITSILRRVKGDNAAADSKKTPSEQNKSVTVLYAKATDYAELLEEQQGSEAARIALHAFWSASEQTVGKYGGRIISRTDTELLALWGTELAREDDIEQALGAALAIQSSLRQFAGGVLSENDSLPLNIGVNSGLALLTPDAKSGSVSVSGTTVNIANRLMHSAEGTILVTHEVFRRTLGIFDMSPGMALKIRGRAENIDTYNVIGAKSRSFRLVAPAVEGIETRQIGRENELRSLENALIYAIEEQETQVVTIVGEAGLGKSRLLYEFQKGVELRPEQIRVFSGRATAGMIERPYSLIRSLMSFRCEIQDNDLPEVVRQKLEGTIVELVGENSEMAHMIGYLCGFDVNDSPHIKGLLDDPSQIVSRARHLFVRLFTTMAHREPVMLALEDIHLADDPSLDLLNEVFTADPRMHLVAVATARPELYERRPTWGSGQTFHQRLVLTPLDKRSSRDLVREILIKVPDISKTLRDILVDRAEGNPYYLEELIKTLIDNRVIVKESTEVWRIEESRVGALKLPSTLVGLLEARFDTLLHPEKLTLQRASVIGRVFYDTALKALDSADETNVSQVSSVLEKLTSRGFIERRETTAFAGSIEYTFSSGMLRDALVNVLLRRQVVRYNRAAAEWLISTAGDRASEYAFQIAEHYEKAGDRERAGEILFRAGEQAYGVGAYPLAASLLERAISSLSETSSTLHEQISLKLTAVYYHIGNYDAGLKYAALALATAIQQGDVDGQTEALTWEATIWHEKGDLEKAERRLREAEALNGVSPAIRSRMFYVLAIQAYWRNDISQMAVSAQASFDAAKESGSTLCIIDGLRIVGITHFVDGKHDEAVQLTEQSLALAQSIGSRRQIGQAYNNLGEDYRLQKKYIEARNVYNLALQLAIETGDRNMEIYSLSNLAVIELTLRNSINARGHALAVLKLARLINNQTTLPSAVGELAGAEALEGSIIKALNWLGAAMNHPAINDVTISDLEIVFDIFRETLTEAEIEAGLEAGKSIDFGAMVNSLLDEA